MTRHSTSRIGLAAAVLLCLATVPAGTASAGADGDRPSGMRTTTPRPTEAAPGQVGLEVPAWTTTDGPHKATAWVVYPSDDPPASWDGQPIQIQVRHAGAPWTTVGEAAQEPAPGEPAGSLTKLSYTLPITGDVQIRAKAYSTETSRTSPVLAMPVVEDPAYAPTALRGTGRYYCWDPVIARDPSRIAYGCPTYDEYDYESYLYNAKTDKRTLLDDYTDYPDLAADANVAIAQELVYSGEDLSGYRVHRYDLDTGKSRPVAFKRDGKRARIAQTSSVSANGKRVAYSSPTGDIAPAAPKGWNVYVADAGSKRSRYVGHGDGSDLAAFGRYVVWRTPDGKVRRQDLRTDRTSAVTREGGHRPESLGVSAGGRYVAFSTKRDDGRVVRVYDAEDETLSTIATGSSPTISDNGRYVAYLGEGKRELYVWDRETDTTELISVGPSGTGSGAVLSVPDISSNGRWIVATSESPDVVPDNGRGEARNLVVLFDREAARG